MFENPPGWTEPLANLTAWFHWEAIGAVGSVGALFWAINLSAAASVEQRRRSAVIVLGASQIIRSLALSIEQLLDTQGDPDASPFAAHRNNFLSKRHWERFSAYDIGHFPSTTSVVFFQSAMSIAKHVENYIELCDSFNHETYEHLGEVRAELRALADDLKAEAEMLNRGKVYRRHAALSLAQSLKSLPARLRTMWTGRPAA
ncbi:MAG: hypothetical protein ACK4Z5_03345 [Brevundimonas sp.]